MAVESRFMHVIRCVATLVVALAAGCSDPAKPATEAEPPKRLLLATTTSVRDSGLLDALLPTFEKRTGIVVNPIAVGTGAALRMGTQGNADVLLTHAPGAEQPLLDSGAAVSRVPFMENYFVIAGPAADPAGVKGAASAVAALRAIGAGKLAFVSRGDDSGTHKKEKALLTAAGLPEKPAWPGFTITGAGMGPTLMVAAERKAYVLTDIGTFLAFRKRTGLVALSRAEPALRNEYSLLRINPKRFKGIHSASAQAFEAFLLQPDTLATIAKFGVDRYGRALFVPLKGDATL